MAEYSYTAQSVEGEKKSGTLKAANKRQLARQLRRQGFVLTSVTAEGGKPKKRKGIEIDLSSILGVSTKDKLFFTRNLKVMVSAGVALPRALRILSEQVKSGKFSKALTEVAAEVTRGEALSDALAKYPGIFSELFVNLIKVGEESGTLEGVLANQTRHLKRTHDLKSKIKGAMIYPAVILVAMIGIGILMLVMVVPKLTKTFEELEVPLPPTTKFVMGLGNFLANRWYLILGAIPPVLVGLRSGLKSKPGKRIWDTVVLRIPIFSSLVIKSNAAYTVRTLSSLLDSGVPIVRSLEITAGALQNIHFKKVMLQASKKVKKGTKLSKVIAAHPVYPALVPEMLKVGEETGETAQILRQLADFFEEEVATATKNLSSVIEPVLMLIIGAVVGFFAISMIQPMYSMLEAVK